MSTKKSLCFSLALFVIMVWIWGFATPALSETLKCKSESKVIVSSYDSVVEDDFYIGVTAREGSATCENGETATVKSFTVWNAIVQKELFAQGYHIYRFKDHSKIFTKGKLTLIPDPKGEAEWIWEGTSEIIKGTNRFKGIKGSISTKFKQLPPDQRSITEFTITYTLPPK